MLWSFCLQGRQGLLPSMTSILGIMFGMSHVSYRIRLGVDLLYEAATVLSAGCRKGWKKVITYGSDIKAGPTALCRSDDKDFCSYQVAVKQVYICGVPRFSRYY